MNAQARAVLEFETTLERVAARAGSALGREAVLRLRPGRDLGSARRELDRVGEVMFYLATHADWAPPVVPEAGPPLRTLEVEGGVPAAAGFVLLSALIESAGLLSRALEDRELERPPAEGEEAHGGTPPARGAADFPHLRELKERLVRRPDLLERIRKVVDPEGEVREDASPALRSLRRRLRGARSRIVARLESHMAALPERIRVADASVSVRDGRYVIPVRREGMREMGGIVHGESASGATIFVEPPLAIQLMNEIHELEREADREIQRLLRQLSGEVRPAREELSISLETLVEFDSLHARARTARTWKGTIPELVSSEEGTLRIVDGRHPLLLEQDPEGVVPFDLELEPGERALVVSGPNTGGKTVLLKSIGLFHLLAQAGIIPPVGPGTRLPLVRDVFADIGDGQSISESLSTFSSHLARMQELLDEAGPGSLVLIDEMGTGTDPAEGAALARAILETLVERGVRAVVTSHLGALKRLDTTGSGIVNASLLFDAERIQPTYRFRKGRPGRSYGLAIAARSGLPDSVVELARGYVDSGELEVEDLLADLEGKERRLAEALQAAEAAEERARRLEEGAEAREREVRERERTQESRAREEARSLLLEAREEVEEAIRTVRSADSGERPEAERDARRRVEAAARRQRPSPAPEPRSGPSRTFEAGETVRVVGTGARGTVREVRNQRALVDVGGMRFEVPLSELEPGGGGRAGGAADKGSASGATGSSPAPVGSTSVPDVTPRFEADLRGLRVDEVELELGRAVDAAVLGGLAELRIIHGKGTGAVKARVLELLPRDSRVQEFRPGGPGEGGGGVTVAALR